MCVSVRMGSTARPPLAYSPPQAYGSQAEQHFWPSSCSDSTELVAELVDSEGESH